MDAASSTKYFFMSSLQGAKSKEWIETTVRSFQKIKKYFLFHRRRYLLIFDRLKTRISDQ